MTKEKLLSDLGFSDEYLKIYKKIMSSLPDSNESSLDNHNPIYINDSKTQITEGFIPYSSNIIYNE